ncbi:MAG TPA: sigma-70 family RNA polymerase sigma factor [Candidatus Deferrimicrobium sp.]|nr:sigma-70 family RNA polymerase sigma factor [Candidatus Deferrimicrobium sp.]
MTVALHQAVAGDEAAFARIVSAYHADMVRVAYGICGQPDLALDAVQAAWMIAWRKLRTVRQPDRLRSWLVAVAANEARHIVRRAHPGRVVEIPVDQPDRSAPDPSDEIRRLDLVNALHKLTPEDRSLIALRYGAALDSSEIAPLLGISASGVRARLFRIMGRLRKELDDV